MDAHFPASPWRHVLVLGLGISGLALTRWHVRCGARVTVVDTRAEPPGRAELAEFGPGVSLVHASFDAAVFNGDMDALCISPGLSPAQTEVARAQAAGRGCPVCTELDVFARALGQLRAERGYAPKVLAVTGTNGKTTVTALTGLLVERGGARAAVAGNIGPSLLDTLAEALQLDALPECWVVELSSFQLHEVKGFEPTAATVLNVSEDHLDWHGSMDAYAADKARIFGDGSLMVLNRDDSRVMAMLPPAVRQRGGRMTQRAHVCFGTALPQRPGDYGLETVNGMVWLVRAHESTEPQRTRATPEQATEPLTLQRLMPAEALRIRGRHNALNALAALALASAAGLPLGPMLYGLREYRGEPHRVEPIGIVDEVEYFDDSKGTNVGATVAALEGLGQERRLVVILGGDGKGQDFSPLAEPLARYARAAVVIGRDADRIRQAVSGRGLSLFQASSLEDAVVQCAELAQAGDAVLMSPACASLDMFRNYGHRAEAFRAAVQQLAEAAGSTLEGAT